MCARIRLLVAVGLVSFSSSAVAADWPQWRGPNRDAKVTGFDAPATWPKTLTKKWRVTVGDGVATPALVGDKLYVFSRQDANEIFRCLDAATGKELWQDKYPAQGATGAASGFAGPRSSPTVADGKVVTLGVRGALCCYDAASGKKLWSKDDSKPALPRFFTSSSPIIVGGLCVVQIGGESDGAMVAYDLTSGDEKWKWTGDGTAYASPVLLTLAGAPVIVAETAKNIVGIGATDGKLLWKTGFAVQGRGYNACTPVVDGQTIVFSGSSRGTKAVKLEKQGDEIVAKDLWSNSESSVQFSTPVVKNDLVFGISDREALFCIDTKTGKTAWTTPLSRGRGYGTVVDAGPVMLAMTPTSELTVFEPTAKEFKKLASYKVTDTDVYAYPILAGNRVFIKDREALTLWSIE